MRPPRDPVGSDGVPESPAAQHRARTGQGEAWILLHQFKSLIVLLLIAATVVAFLLGESVEATAILVVILLNASIGFLIE